jgi:hypothetical protein
VTPDNVHVGFEIWAQTSGVERLDLCSVCDTPIVSGRIALPRFTLRRGVVACVEYDDPHGSDTTFKVFWTEVDAKGRRYKVSAPLRTSAFRPQADGLSEAQHLIANTVAEIFVKEIRAEWAAGERRNRAFESCCRPPAGS